MMRVYYARLNRQSIWAKLEANADNQNKEKCNGVCPDRVVIPRTVKTTDGEIQKPQDILCSGIRTPHPYQKQFIKSRHSQFCIPGKMSRRLSVHQAAYVKWFLSLTPIGLKSAIIGEKTTDIDTIYLNSRSIICAISASNAMSRRPPFFVVRVTLTAAGLEARRGRNLRLPSPAAGGSNLVHCTYEEAAATSDST